MGSLHSHPPFPHRFPPLLLRPILELAASAHPRTAAALVLVCRQFQAWVEPILYATVVLSSASQTALFKATLSHRSSLQHAVRTLVVRLPANLDVQLLSDACPALQSLYIDVAEMDTLRTVSTPATLRQLTVCGPLSRTSLRPLPAFQSTTHLVFLADVPRGLGNSPSIFPKLTHFACRWRVRGKAACMFDHSSAADVAVDLAHVLHLVLRCSELQVFVLIVQDDDASQTPSIDHIQSNMLESVSQHLSDDRVVLVGVPPNSIPSANLLEEWQLQNGLRWQEARKEVRRRREHMKKPLCSSL